MEVIHLTEADIPEWNDYVVKHPYSTFYHRIEWKNIIEKSFGHKTFYLMAVNGSKLRTHSSSASSISHQPSAMSYVDSNRVVGILPLVHLKSHLFGSIFCSMPFLNFGGICSDSKAAEKALLEESKKILKNEGGSYIELRHLKKSSLELPNKTHKVSMALELDPDPNVLWNNFKTKHRTNIRRAKKNNLEIKIGGKELLQDFYKIMCIGWRDLGTPFYKYSFFENIFKMLNGSIQIYLVMHQGKPIATAFNGLSRDTIEGMWTYSLKEFYRLQTNYFLYWEMINHACQEGYKWYHLGRSTNETGATFYKKKWNAVTRQLYWEYILNESKGSRLPELNVDNPKYQLAINSWRKMPVWFTKLIGPHIAKNIP